MRAPTVRNPVPHVVYVWLWVGLAFASMLFGPVWRVINPVRLLHGPVAARSGLPRRRGLPLSRGVVAGRAGARRLHLGRAGGHREHRPSFLRLLILGYLLVSILGAGLFGRAWFDRADPFGAWSSLLGALAPLGRRDDGRWVLRTPLHGINELRGERGLVATVAVMLGSTAYDGFSANLSWATFVQTSAVPASVLKTATMLGFFVAVAVTLWLASAASMALSGRSGTPSTWSPSSPPHSSPIAGGYVVAHYWSLFVYQAPVGLALLSDPLGTGADLLGTAGITPNDTLVQATLVATIQSGQHRRGSPAGGARGP